MYWLLSLLVLVLASSFGTGECFSRANFPESFLFGVASSAYQYEGAASEGGRKPSTWDNFARLPGKIRDSSNADVTVDEYHRFKEHIALMVDLGIDVYRFSISWPRIFPDGERGTPPGTPNAEGVAYYNSLIDALLDNGIIPYVTLFHWDTPLTLEKSYGSWLNRQIVQDFVDYADTCFQLFGDRVKNWITINEPHMQASSGYNIGVLAPGRCSRDVSANCTGGNSATEPYLVTHNFLLAHASVVQLYRSKYQSTQRGSIGLSIDATWFEPLTTSAADVEAAQRARDFEVGWYLDPIFLGHYPHSMISLVGDRLPKFTDKEATMVKGSVDFLGVNHYTTYYATMKLDDPLSYLGYYRDHKVAIFHNKDGVPIGPGTNGIYNVPWGLSKLLEYIRTRYENPPVIMTENGISDLPGSLPSFGNGRLEFLDQSRVNYLNGYLSHLLESIHSGSDVRGYFVWSLLDNWEWTNGYRWRFGLYYVDFKNNLKMFPKESAKWFKQFLTVTHKSS